MYHEASVIPEMQFINGMCAPAFWFAVIRVMVGEDMHILARPSNKPLREAPERKACQ